MVYHRGGPLRSADSGNSPIEKWGSEGARCASSVTAMTQVPTNFPPAYVEYLSTVDEGFRETVLMAMKQSVAEGLHGILVNSRVAHHRQAEVSETVPYGQVIDAVH